MAVLEHAAAGLGCCRPVSVRGVREKLQFPRGLRRGQLWGRLWLLLLPWVVPWSRLRKGP